MSALKPYTKTFQDELDFKLLDQFHAVVLQLSGFCFETKKFCVTTEFIVLPLIAKFTKDELDSSIFIAALLIPICFWVLDSVAYFYQVKLRGIMKEIHNRLSLKENNNQLVISDCVIENRRVESSTSEKIINSLFNHSMWLYAFMIFIDAVVSILFVIGKIT
jgi:hypothetical protein